MSGSDSCHKDDSLSQRQKQVRFWWLTSLGEDLLANMVISVLLAASCYSGARISHPIRTHKPAS